MPQVLLKKLVFLFHKIVVITMTPMLKLMINFEQFLLDDFFRKKNLINYSICPSNKKKRLNDNNLNRLVFYLISHD